MACCKFYTRTCSFSFESCDDCAAAESISRSRPTILVNFRSFSSSRCFTCQKRFSSDARYTASNGLDLSAQIANVGEIYSFLAFLSAFGLLLPLQRTRQARPMLAAAELEALAVKFAAHHASSPALSRAILLLAAPPQVRRRGFQGFS